MINMKNFYTIFIVFIIFMINYNTVYSVLISKDNNFNNDTELHNNNSESCVLCHIITDFIRHDINIGNSTLQLILEITEDIVCAVAPKYVCNDCKSVINATEKIINMISKGFSDKKICKKLKFCDNTYFQNKILDKV